MVLFVSQPSNMREKYKNLKKESLQNAEHVEKLQGELDSITSKQQQIEQSLQVACMNNNMSHMKWIWYHVHICIYMCSVKPN